MSAEKQGSCPDLFDIEPTCYSLEPTRVLEFAQGIARELEFPEPNPVRIAMALMIPRLGDEKRLLYALRSPQYHTEFPNTWGLPSVGVSAEELLHLQGDTLAPTLSTILARLSERKLGNLDLVPQEIVAWTGRARNHHRDDRFTESYYLLMLDALTQPVSADDIPSSTSAYLDFTWLTPQEHEAFIKSMPKVACGACSQLALAASKAGKI